MNILCPFSHGVYYGYVTSCHMSIPHHFTYFRNIKQASLWPEGFNIFFLFWFPHFWYGLCMRWSKGYGRFSFQCFQFISGDQSSGSRIHKRANKCAYELYFWYLRFIYNLIHGFQLCKCCFWLQSSDKNFWFLSFILDICTEVLQTVDGFMIFCFPPLLICLWCWSWFFS